MGKKFISSIVLDSDNVTVKSVKDAHIVMCKMLMEEPVGTEMMTLLASANGGASATVLLKYTRRADGPDGAAIVSHDFVNSVKLKQFGISWSDIKEEPKDVSLREQKAVEYASSKCPFRWSHCDGSVCQECVFKDVHSVMVRDYLAGWDEAMKQKKVNEL